MKHVDTKGRLVLQDLPGVLEEAIQLHPPVETHPYDFFVPQPVLGEYRAHASSSRAVTHEPHAGAWAYFLQDIFHNWPTSVAKLILRNVAGALASIYSIWLISETALPDQDCPLDMAGLAWGMMYLYLGLERSEQQWQDLMVARS